MTVALIAACRAPGSYNPTVHFHWFASSSSVTPELSALAGDLAQTLISPVKFAHLPGVIQPVSSVYRQNQYFDALFHSYFLAVAKLRRALSAKS